jgi:signal transduction histidine kinase
MFFKRIRTRMVVHVIWIVTIVTIISCFITYKVHEHALKQHLQDDAEVASSIVENLIPIVMRHKDPAILHEIFPELTRLHHLKNVRIVAPNQRIVFSSEPAEVNELIQSPNFAEFAARPRETQVTQTQIENETTFQQWGKLRNTLFCQDCHGSVQEINGYAWVETSDRVSITAVASTIMVPFLIAIGVIIILSVVTASVFVRSVDRPIQSLKKMMDALKRGDFSSRITNVKQDELGTLAEGLNSMAEKLQESKTRLAEDHRQELDQAESLAKIGQMAAGVAHEIKNPISGIVFAANSILRDMDPKDNQYEIFEEIVAQANRVEQNLESMLMFAKYNRVERFPTDLNAIIERILVFIRQQPDMKLITISNMLAGNLPEVLVDPKQMEQVLLNLIINAVQAMPHGGELTVCSRHDVIDNTVMVSVGDTGVGIPKASRDKIFEPFFTTKQKGVGLGLALCREIISRHNGFLSLKSTENVGTTISFELPVGTLAALEV